MKKNRLLRHIGNALILLSLTGTIFILFPLANIFLFPPRIEAINTKSGTYITIPKISAQAQVIEHVDPFNPAEYQPILKKGVAHAKNSSLPGEIGTSYIFAHSSGAPWELTRLNTVFLRLNELKPGDTIEIYRNKKSYKYIVKNSLEVNPQDIQYLLNDEKTQLILQTCTPIGTDWKRLLVFAELKKD